MFNRDKAKWRFRQIISKEVKTKWR